MEVNITFANGKVMKKKREAGFSFSIAFSKEYAGFGFRGTKHYEGNLAYGFVLGYIGFTFWKVDIENVIHNGVLDSIAINTLGKQNNFSQIDLTSEPIDNDKDNA